MPGGIFLLKDPESRRRIVIGKRIASIAEWEVGVGISREEQGTGRQRNIKREVI